MLVKPENCTEPNPLWMHGAGVSMDTSPATGIARAEPHTLLKDAL